MNTALLLIDIQNDYFQGGSMTLDGADEAAQNAQQILKHFRENGNTIIHIQHIANRPTATFFLPNTVGAEIHSSVSPAEGETVIVKHFPNSFRETELLEVLKEKNIQQLAICGMMTHMCVEATTRAAKDFGFDCIVVADACATKELEVLDKKIPAKDVQNSFLAGLSYFYATIITANEWNG